jgi:hypothetical protein
MRCVRKAGGLNICCFCLSRLSLGPLIRIKAEMGRFGVGQRDRVTMWGMFYCCTVYEDDTKRRSYEKMRTSAMLAS